MRITIKTDIQGDVNKVEEILHNMTNNFFVKASELGFSVVNFNKYIESLDFETHYVDLVKKQLGVISSYEKREEITRKLELFARKDETHKRLEELILERDIDLEKMAVFL